MLFCFGLFYFSYVLFQCMLYVFYATHQTCGKLESQPCLDICKVSFTFDHLWRIRKGNNGKICKLDSAIFRHRLFQSIVASRFFSVGFKVQACLLGEATTKWKVMKACYAQLSPHPLAAGTFEGYFPFFWRWDPFPGLQGMSWIYPSPRMPVAKKGL